jgi:hypothetical protein
MVAIKEFITKELESLNEEQLRQVADFLSFLKFRSRSRHWTIDESQIAALYSEFAEEDRILAEEGLDEYAELLRQEDLK